MLSVTTYLGFWGTKSVLGKELKQQKLDYDQCWKQVNYLQNKKSTLKEISHGVWTNDSSTFMPYYNLLATVTQE